MKHRFLTATAIAAGLAASTFLGSTAEAQFVRASVTTELVRGLGGLNRLAPKKAALRRYAIVIGNRDYEHIEDLKNADNDARAVAAFLRENDFTVFDAYDVDKRRFERLLRRALLEFDGNSEVLFYFAGHGMQIGRRNYLLPTDVTLENVHDVPFETVTLDQLLALLSSRTRLQLVILDSCRENPFNNLKLATGLDSELFETSAGFSQASAPINTLLSFSTSPGSLALDGAEGGNSPFTAALINAARAAPTDSIGRILEEVRRRVYAQTNGRQVPWESSTLVEPFLFRAKADARETLVAAAPPTVRPSPKEDVVTTAPPPIASAAPKKKLNLPAPTDATLTEALVASASGTAQTATDAGSADSAAPSMAASTATSATTAAAAAPVAATTAVAAASAKTATAADATTVAAAVATTADAAVITSANAKTAAAADTTTAVAAPSAAADTLLAALPPSAAATPTEKEATAPAPAPVTMEIQPTVIVDLTAPLDRDINVGSRIADVIDLPEGARIRVVRAPDSGSLVFQSGKADEYASTSEGIQLAFLTYDLHLGERSALAPSADMVIDYFDLEMEHDGRITPLSVSLASEADACDVQAGDWLDPDGVGIARYPNQLEPEVALAACEAAVERQPEVGRFQYQLGRAYLAMRRYDDAETAFVKARDLGHIRAWFAIGELSADRAIAIGGGKNERSPDSVLANYAMGVAQGDAYAMHALGKQLLRHGRTKAEKEEGYELLSRAVEVGHTFAMNELGYYFMAKGTDHYQPARGLEYLRASAEREDIYGYNNLGLVYDRGLGDFEKDPKQALDWYLKAAAGGHPYAPVNAGRIYYRGLPGGAPDATEAVRFYDMGLERGDGWGGANAAWIILNKPIDGLGPADAAIRAAKAAALRGDKAAKRARGLMGKMNNRTLTTATQTLLNDMGADVTVDGLYGGETRDMINAMAAENGVTPDLSTPQHRLLTVATLYWRRNPLRLDLY